MILDRTKQPETSIPTLDANLNLAEGVIGTVIPVYLLEGGTEPVVKIDVVFPAGTRYEHKSMVASSCLSMIMEGTESYSSFEISQLLDYYGARIGLDLDKDRVKISLLCLTEHFPKLVDLFSELITCPIFLASEFELLKQRRKSALRVNLEKVEFQCRLEFSRKVFGSHPYGESFSVEELEDLNVDDLLLFFNEYMRLENSFFLVSGKDSQSVLGLLDQTIKLKGTRAKGVLPNQDYSWDYKSSENFIEREGSLQSAIRIGSPAVNRTHPDYPALYAANMILGGFFGSRLMQNIREEKGYTYGINSGLSCNEEASIWTVRTQVGAEFTMPTISEIRKECNRMISEPVGVSELDLAKRYIAGSLIQNFDGPFARAEKVDIILRNELPLDFYNSFSSDILNLTPKDVQVISSKYFNPDNFVVAVVGSW